MFKGVSTLVEYDECIKKGLCEEHLKEINQNELDAVKNEFPRKAFKFVRVNILYPLLTSKAPKCEKMKKLMEKTPPIAKVLTDGKAGKAISEEAANVILIVDSVVIFTICQLSKICCIGALFHTKKINDPIGNNLQKLLLVERLNADIRYLYPVLQKNFIGFDLDIIRATHCITLLFIRKFCNKGSIKKAIETIENDIKTNCEFDQVKVVCNEYNYKNLSCVIRKTSHSSSAPFKFYCSTDYLTASEYFLANKKYELAALYGYLALSMEDSVGDAYYPIIKAFLNLKLFNEALEVVLYGIKHCKKDDGKHLKNLNRILEAIKKQLVSVPEAASKASENSVNMKEIMKSFKKEKSKSGLVDLVDSDSGASDAENHKDTPELVEAIDSDENSETIVKKKESNSEPKEESKSKSPECIKENAVSQDVPTTTDAVCSDDESEAKKKKPLMNGTKEKTKNKSYSSARRKRTISEGSVDNQLEDEIDVNKINSYLKEASEALLADCGYKAVQIFRGPLRKFIESSDFPQFEECDIVCIKYSYGIAYCKSGGHDDLEKCITILKDIVEKHDSIPFPAVYYSLGLAFRKLNRFKEALNYLEIAQNFVLKGIHFKVYSWPGMTTVIQETKPDTLKSLIEDLIKECENPPNPDAYCRHKSCNFQPMIYYTDPDFKGYVSLTCSEQCNLQYHLQCWKSIKEENNLTDKDFLEKPCYTPDCEGFIVKIQNIDKKGDLSKEFTSEFKRPQKPKKWDKKADVKEKEKKKKKSSVRSEGGSQEILVENGKDRSRKSSVCDSEISENRKDNSRDSSVELEEPPAKLLGYFTSSSGQISYKFEGTEKSSENLKQKIDVSASSLNNCDSSSLQENLYINNEENLELNAQQSTAEYALLDCIKNNAYSFMADFLHHHGPLRTDDPLLTNEIEAFPDDLSKIIRKDGGIGEFLKNDLRFAYVGDLYVCVIDDLAKAYQMLSNTSLPCDFKNFPPLESAGDSKFYSESKTILDKKHSSFLNPDAQEYTPSNKKDSVYKFTANNLHPQESDSHCSLPLGLESPSKYLNTSQLDALSGTDMLTGKSKSCEIVSDSKFQTNDKELITPYSYSKEKETTNDSTNNSKLYSDSLIGNSKIDREPSAKCREFLFEVTNGVTNSASVKNTNLKDTKTEVPLLDNLKQYLNREMAENSQEIKSYLLKKNEYVSRGTITDITLQDNKILENISLHNQDDSVIEGLRTEIHDLSKQNLSLQNVLECTTEQQQKLTVEVIHLKKCLVDANAKIEIAKRECDKKEKEYLKEKEALVQCLTDANKMVGNLQQKNTSLAEEKLKLQKTADSLTLMLKREGENRKNVLEAQEKKFNAVIESLQKENAELKNRTKHAELQVLYMKKTEYLKKIEAKSLEVEEVKKEMNTPSMQLWAKAAGPEQMKILTAKLKNYVDELNATRVDFVEKIDEQIKKVKNGASLKDLKEIVMKDLAPVPTYKNTLPDHLLSEMSKFNSLSMPYFGTSTCMPSNPVVPSVPATSVLLSSATSGLKITPPSAAAAKIVPPLSPAIATTIIPPGSATIIPPTSATIIPPGSGTKIAPHVAPVGAKNGIPPVTPAATLIPPPMTPASLTSLPSASSLNANKGSKMDLVSEIDPTVLQESFKNAMASINSFASTPYNAPSLDDEFDKNCVVFKHPDPIPNDIKADHPKVPPGLVNSVPLSTSLRASAITPIPEPVAEASSASAEKSYAGLDAVPKMKVEPNQTTWEPEKKKATNTANYAKLLNKLKEKFPTYSQEELMSYVKEVRAQRQGKLSGLTIDAIISEISAIMKTKKKMPELKIQPKPSKVLVNKKLVPDPKPPLEPQTTKKKTAWNIDTDASQRTFSVNPDDDCTICCDTMANSAYKVTCGHYFHEDCIRQWLKKNSNCPICRVLLLLPEEYPSLS